eukprot:74704-Pleurochrysis_carterae.AAC.1
MMRRSERNQRVGNRSMIAPRARASEREHQNESARGAGMRGKRAIADCTEIDEKHNLARVRAHRRKHEHATACVRARGARRMRPVWRGASAGVGKGKAGWRGAGVESVRALEFLRGKSGISGSPKKATCARERAGPLSQPSVGDASACKRGGATVR